MVLLLLQQQLVPLSLYSHSGITGESVSVVFDRMVESDYTDIDVSYGKMYKEIIAYSIPFVIVSLNYPLFNLIINLHITVLYL